ncbi:MAG TPA: DMT family transporter [Candidatus Tenderia sp.]|nr:DMT family transporter [Candidatus Tenderia sp.]
MLTRHHATRGIVLSLMGFSLLSFGDAAIKFLSPHYSTYSLVFYNSVFGLLTLMILSPWLGGVRNTLRDKRIKLHLLRGLLVFVQLSLIVYAFGQMSLAKAYAIIFTAPLFSTLLAIPLLKDHVSWKHWLGIAVGFIGVLVVLRPGLIPLDVGALAALASALFFSLVNITTRYMRHTRHTLLSWGFYPHLVIITILLLFFSAELQRPQPGHLVYMVFLGSVSVFGAIAVARAFAYVPTVTAASFHYVQMLWGVSLGYVLFGDALEVWTALGAAIIIAGGLWLIHVEKCKIAVESSAALKK